MSLRVSAPDGVKVRYRRMHVHRSVMACSDMQWCLAVS